MHTSRTLLSAALLLSIALAAACGAPPGRPAADARRSYDRVAFVDMSRVLRETAAGAEVREQLEGAEREIRSQLEDMRAELEALAAEIEEAQAAETPDEEALQRLVGEYQAMAQRAQQAQGAAQAQLEQYRAQLTEPIVADVREICERIGEEEDYGIILERTGLAYADEGVDITDQIIRELGGGGASSGTGALIREALRAREEEPGPDSEETAEPGSEEAPPPQD